MLGNRGQVCEVRIDVKERMLEMKVRRRNTDEYQRTFMQDWRAENRCLGVEGKCVR